MQVHSKSKFMHCILLWQRARMKDHVLNDANWNMHLKLNVGMLWLLLMHGNCTQPTQGNQNWQENKQLLTLSLLGDTSGWSNITHTIFFNAVDYAALPHVRETWGKKKQHRNPHKSENSAYLTAYHVFLVTYIFRVRSELDLKSSYRTQTKSVSSFLTLQ